MNFKFAYLMLILALTVAGCAAFFSVYGISQLFAGASTAVIIMASVLEIGKIVTTTALHRYWKRIAKSLRVYLTISVVVLMFITSAGIYGFLSNAYQKTANKVELHEGEVSVLTRKKDLFQKTIDDNQKIIDSKNKRISQLSDIRDKQENRLDDAKSVWAKDKVRNDIRVANGEIQKLSGDIDNLNAKNQIVSDSISKYSVKSLELEGKSSVAGEVGPLKYISKLTGQPMDKVVNVLILLLIFVFDPLAIALILMTNRVFELEKVINPLEPDYLTTLAEDLVTEKPQETYQNTVEEPQTNTIEEITPEIQAPIIEEPSKPRDPVIPTGKVNVEDIREVKNRGYSVDVSKPKTNNTIERVGSNKIVKNGDNNNVFFNRNK